MTTGESIMQEILARLQGSPPLMWGPSPQVAVTVRRAHRTPVTRDMAPGVDLIDGPDTPKPAKNDCRTERTREFEVVPMIRSDAGVSAIDDLVSEINDRLNPATAYSTLGVLRQLQITPDEEVADLDVIAARMRFAFDYQTTGWPLT